MLKDQQFSQYCRIHHTLCLLLFSIFVVVYHQTNYLNCLHSTGFFGHVISVAVVAGVVCVVVVFYFCSCVPSNYLNCLYSTGVICHHAIPVVIVVVVVVVAGVICFVLFCCFCFCCCVPSNYLNCLYSTRSLFVLIYVSVVFFSVFL